MRSRNVKSMSAALALLFALALPASQAAAQWRVPPEVLAFYYGWYANPEVSGEWIHWRGVDVAHHTIASATNYPLLGPYDSHDPKVVDQHCRWAKQAGLTGFIVSWWRQGSIHDEGMPLMLATAQKYGLKITIYYETVPPRESPAPAGAVNDFLYLLHKYAGHPAWLRVRGKPVFFVYGRAIGQIKLSGWGEVIRRVNQQYPGGALFLGARTTPEAAQIFDGIHVYNVTGKTAHKSLEAIRAWAETAYPEVVATAGGKISCVTVIPGYDDHKLGRDEPRPITPRYGGETYRVLWEEAIAAQPDWILITSWNEWHEGSEIEPSLENGSRELEATADFTPQFLRRRARTGGPRLPVPAHGRGRE